MVVSGPHFPLHDPEASWQALVSYGLEAQARHMEQTMGNISQVMGEMSQPGVDRSIGVQVMRELAHRACGMRKVSSRFRISPRP